MLKFKPIYRLAARRAYKEGILTEEQYRQVMETLRWPVRINKETKEQIRVLDIIRDHVYSEIKKEKKAIDWSVVLEWLKDHWKEILKIIISLLIILEPPPKER